MINYLLRGIDSDKGFTKKQEEYLKSDINSNQKIVFIASTFNSHDKNILYYTKGLNWFKEINIDFLEVNLIDCSVTKKEAQKLLRGANVVFLMGGDTASQMNSIREYNLDELIRDKKIVIGVSAGSLNQSKMVVFKDEYQKGKIVEYQGLGLTDINIYPHFNLADKEYTKEVIEISYYVPLVALPNDSFIKIKNNEIWYVGEHYFIDSGKIYTESNIRK